MKNVVAAWVAVLVVAGCANAQEAAAPPVVPQSPAEQPAKPQAESGVAPATASSAVASGATTQTAGDGSVDAILGALDARGDSLQDFTADVSMTDTDNAAGSESTLSGKMWMQRLDGGDARLRVLFDRKVINDKPRAEKLEYVLAGGKLIDRDYSQRIEVTRQVLRPGQKMDLLKLGEGPFPLPLGQSRQDVYRLFEVAQLPAAAGDPAGSVHLRLKPRPGTQFEAKFATIDFWVDPSSQMPVRIVTEDPNGTTTKTTELKAIQVNAGLQDASFAVEKIDEANWRIRAQPYEE